MTSQAVQVMHGLAMNDVSVQYFLSGALLRFFRGRVSDRAGYENCQDGMKREVFA